MDQEEEHFSFILLGRPIAKKRPRFKREGFNVRTYDTQKAEKDAVRLLLMQQMSEQRFIKQLTDPITVRMMFYTVIPKSYSKKRAAECLDKPDPRKPDLDNYIKLYCDAMNGLIYRDDSVVTELHSAKLFSDRPRVEIEIYP